MQEYVIAILFYVASTIATGIAGRILDRYWPHKRDEADEQERAEQGQQFAFRCIVYVANDARETNALDLGPSGDISFRAFPVIPSEGDVFLADDKRFRVYLCVIHSSLDGNSPDGRDADLYVKEV